MTFANPIMLWGLLALAIPIIIHLFNFRKTKKIVFPSTQFIKEVKTSTKKRRNIKEWLILFTRLAFITFLVFAFAEPLRPGDVQDTGGEVIIYIDNSLSMEGEYANGIKKIDHSAILAQDIIQGFPDTYRFRVFTNAGPYRPGLLQSGEQALDLIAGIRTEYQVGRPLAFLEEFIRDSGRQSKELFLISDFQEPEQEPTLSDSLHTFNLLLIESTESSNVFVDSVYLASPFLIAGAENALLVRLKNSGAQDAGAVPVRFSLNEETQGSTSVELKAGEVADVSFPIPQVFEPNARIRIELDDFPNTFDNEFFAVLRPSERITITIISENTPSPYMANVFGNEGLFNMSLFPAGNIDYNQLDEADLVVLNELSTINRALAEAINTRQSANKMTLLIPAENIALEAYQSINNMPLAPLGTTLGTANFATPDIENPYFLDVFAELSDNVELPGAAIRYTFNQQGDAIIKLRNGLNFLMATGPQGKLLSMATPLTGNYTSLGRHALFVPLMYKMAALSTEQNNQLYIRTGTGYLAMPKPSQDTQPVVKLKRNEQEIIPEQRISGNQLIMSFADAGMISGFYEMMLGEEIIGRLAVNIGRQESLQNFLSVEALRQSLSGLQNLKIVGTRELSNFEGELQQRFSGTPFWKLMLLLAIACLFAEILIIRLLR